MKTRFLVLALNALIASSAQADTWVVDDDGGPGVDFLEIADAIAVAEDGDLVRVLAGDYSAFLLQEGVTIQGIQAGVFVTGTTRIADLPSGQLAILQWINFTNLQIHDCEGRVALSSVLGDTSWPASGRVLDVLNCDDVRISESILVGAAAIHTVNSRVEIAQCELDSWIFPGIMIEGGRVHVSTSIVNGGDGGDSIDDCYGFIPDIAGDGAEGIWLDSGELFISGPDGSTTVSGGDGGCGAALACDGFAAYGIRAVSGMVRVSGAIVGGGFDCMGWQTGDYWISPQAQLVIPTEADPALEVSGEQIQDGLLTFTARGEPGASTYVYMGRSATLNPVSSGLIEELVGFTRARVYGVIPASGLIEKNHRIPGFLPRGTTYWVQAQTILPGGEMRLSNSIPIVVR